MHLLPVVTVVVPVKTEWAMASIGGDSVGLVCRNKQKKIQRVGETSSDDGIRGKCHITQIPIYTSIITPNT